MKKIFVYFLMCSVLFASGCRDEQPQIVYQQAPAPAPQTIVIEQDDNDAELAAAAIVGAAATAMIMSNGQRYDGHHWYGPAPRGYYAHNGRLYRDTPYVRKYSKTHAAKVTNVTNVANKPAALVAPVVTTPVKVKNYGDAAAEAQKKQMQAEQSRKAKMEALKADLRAKQAARASAPAQTSSFKSFSKKASSTSSSSKSTSSSRRR